MRSLKRHATELALPRASISSTALGAMQPSLSRQQPAFAEGTLPTALVELCVSWLDWTSHLRVARTCKSLKEIAERPPASPARIGVGLRTLHGPAEERWRKAQAAACGPFAHLWKTRPRQLMILFPAHAYHLESLGHMSTIACLHLVLSPNVRSLRALQTLIRLESLTLARGAADSQPHNFDLHQHAPRLRELNTEWFALETTSTPGQASRLPVTLTSLHMRDLDRNGCSTRAEWRALCGLPLLTALRFRESVASTALQEVARMAATLKHLAVGGVDLDEDNEEVAHVWSDSALLRALSALRLQSLDLGDYSNSLAARRNLHAYLVSATPSLQSLSSLSIEARFALHEVLSLARTQTATGFAKTLVLRSLSFVNSLVDECDQLLAKPLSGATPPPPTDLNISMAGSKGTEVVLDPGSMLAPTHGANSVTHLDVSGTLFLFGENRALDTLPEALCRLVAPNLRSLHWRRVNIPHSSRVYVLPASLAAGLRELDLTGRKVSLVEIRRLCPQLQRLGVPVCSPVEFKQLAHHDETADAAQKEQTASRLDHLSHLSLRSCADEPFARDPASAASAGWLEAFPKPAWARFLDIVDTLQSLPALRSFSNLEYVPEAKRKQAIRLLRERLPRVRLPRGFVDNLCDSDELDTLGRPVWPDA